MRAVSTPFPAVDPEAALGSRVVVRHRLSEPDAVGHTLSDVVGELVQVGPGSLTVATRHGPVVLARADVTAFKVVPPRPSRRGAPHRALSVEDLERVMVDAWPPLEREWLGGWMLRAAGGFTRRANSCLALGSPGMPYPQAVAAVESWYAARRLPASIVLSGPPQFDPERDPLGHWLTDQGWVAEAPALVLTAASSAVVAAAGADATVACAADPGPDWLAAHPRYGAAPRSVAARVLGGSPSQRFAIVRDDRDTVVGVARLGLAHGWGGIAAMWVAPAARRRGIAGRLLGALAARALEAGAASLHLAVEAANTPALRAYARYGFTAHHDYAYVRAPSGAHHAHRQSTRANCPR